MPSKKIIILLEHEGQVKRCLNSFKDMKGQTLLIALSPFAMCELDRRDIRYGLLEDYYDPEELFRLGMGNYQKVEKLCHVIDRSLSDACPSLAEAGIRPALFSFGDLKVIYDTVTTRLFQLSKLIVAEKPTTVFVYADKPRPFGSLYFDYRESIYARLLALPGWGVDVKMLPHVPYPEDLDVIKKTRGGGRTFEKIKRWIQRYPKLFDLAAEYNARGWRGLFRRLKSSCAGNGIQVLLFGQGLNWDDGECREQMRAAGFDPIFNRMRDSLGYWIAQPSDLDISILSNVWRGLLADNGFRKFFVMEDIDFLPVLEERLRFLVERLAPACLSAYKETARIIKEREVKIYLTSAFDSCTSHSAALAARNLNVLVVDWQHAIHGLTDHPIVNYGDLRGPDIFFVWGEQVANKYSKQAKRFGTKLVVIGSTLLEALEQMPRPIKAEKHVKLKRDKKVVLFALAPLFQNNFFISTYPARSDNLLWRVQRAILDVLGKHKGCTAIIKLKPGGNRDPPVRRYAKEKGLENCQFIRGECSFTDLLPLADVVVLNSPSTTLLQSLMTSKPVFLYTGHIHLDARARRLLDRRVFRYDDSKSLTEALNRYLSEGKIDKEVDLNDKEFLKAYGVSSLEMGAGIRAANMLKILKRHDY